MMKMRPNNTAAPILPYITRVSLSTSSKPPPRLPVELLASSCTEMLVSLTGASPSLPLSAWKTIWWRALSSTSDGERITSSRTVDTPSSATSSATKVPPGKVKPKPSSSAALTIDTLILSSSLPLFWNWNVIFTSAPSLIVRVLLSAISKSTIPKVAMLRSPLTEALEARAQANRACQRLSRSPSA